MSITSAVASKLRHDAGAALSGVLQDAVLHEFKVAAHAEVLRQGETPKMAHVVLSGYMFRFRTLADGRRQITAVLLPGDICDVEAVLTGKADYGVGAFTAGRLGRIAIGRFEEVDTLASEVQKLLLRQILRDEAIAREWILGLGRRTALERLAHLFCELWTRLKGVGLATEDGCELRLTQVDLGDILGLSSVHVNRTIQALRATDLIVFQGSTLRINDHVRLRELAGFDPSYLT